MQYRLVRVTYRNVDESKDLDEDYVAFLKEEQWKSRVVLRVWEEPDNTPRESVIKSAQKHIPELPDEEQRSGWISYSYQLECRTGSADQWEHVTFVLDWESAEDERMLSEAFFQELAEREDNEPPSGSGDLGNSGGTTFCW